MNKIDFEQDFQNIESALKNEFDLTLKEISEMENLDLELKISGLNEQHLEKLIELIIVITKNAEIEFKRKLAEKGILMLNFLDRTSKTFSLERTAMKNTLQQVL